MILLSFMFELVVYVLLCDVCEKIFVCIFYVNVSKTTMLNVSMGI
jgi:hypothetical protein